MAPPKVGSGSPVVVPPVTTPVNDPAPRADATAGTAKVQDTFEAAGGPPRFEITKGHTLSEADLQKIPDKDVRQAVRDAQKSYASLLDKGAKLVVTTSAGNGGKPVIAVVPPALANNTDPAKGYNVEVHYHGLDGAASKPNPSRPLTGRIADSFNRQPPTVYVIPEWGGKNDWSNVRNTDTTMKDALKGVAGTPGQLTVSAHSLGRKAIQSAIAHHGLKADRLDIQDAFYSSQPEGPRMVADWMKANPNAQVRILLTTKGAMSDKQTIQKQAPSLPDSVFVDLSKTEQNHWDAELKPW